jgi:hypothetical protein
VGNVLENAAAMYARRTSLGHVELERATLRTISIAASLHVISSIDSITPLHRLSTLSNPLRLLPQFQRKC